MGLPPLAAIRQPARQPVPRLLLAAADIHFMRFSGGRPGLLGVLSLRKIAEHVGAVFAHAPQLQLTRRGKRDGSIALGQPSQQLDILADAVDVLP